MKSKLIIAVLLAAAFLSRAQKLLPDKLQDTGQTGSYTSTSGEDSDLFLNPQTFTDNGDGTITDNNTGLMWQKTDGGEMIFENTAGYCTSLTLGGYSDWRLPTNHELFCLNKYDVSNPAINTVYFTKTSAEYWWTSDVRADDATRVWVVNAGGGSGAHPKSETVSAGGAKKIHIRAVRNPYATVFSVNHFTDKGDGTIKDNFTGLTWQKIPSQNTMSWEEALTYADGLILAGKSDWRLPNIKELQSLNDEKLTKPSFSKTWFSNIAIGNYWSSTTQFGATTRAWSITTDYGLVSYNEKTLKQYVILVRGGYDNNDTGISESLIPGGEFEMGDHFNFVDPAHPSDETPIHKVKVSAFYCAKTETTNQQFLAFLNEWILKNLIEVKSNTVYLTGTTDIVCYTYQFATYYNISFDGKQFSLADFRGNHPMVGVMWNGAVAFCNWLSSQNGLSECYDLKTWNCDYTQNGYRLPSEAEWEFVARGGKLNPYLNYPNGNSLDIKAANLPNSGDPYEIAGTDGYPQTTPAAFYDGKTHLKTEYNWPGSMTSYQTNDGANGFGLYDMQGNVWEFLNDWYGQNYYSLSPYENPRGPASGFIMPDGKPYRGMRGGNWYNGLMIGGISDGHSRVSNRNPSYYRGPQDPNHPYYHLGFRVVRNYDPATGIVETIKTQTGFKLSQNFPNPFRENTTIEFSIPENAHVTLKISNALGNVIQTLANQAMEAGTYKYIFNGTGLGNGVYFCSLQSGGSFLVKQMILMKQQ